MVGPAPHVVNTCKNASTIDAFLFADRTKSQSVSDPQVRAASTRLLEEGPKARLSLPFMAIKTSRTRAISGADKGARRSESNRAHSSLAESEVNCS
jgi:hypothetical protein